MFLAERVTIADSHNQTESAAQLFAQHALKHLAAAIVTRARVLDSVISMNCAAFTAVLVLLVLSQGGQQQQAATMPVDARPPACHCEAAGPALDCASRPLLIALHLCVCRTAAAAPPTSTPITTRGDAERASRYPSPHNPSTRGGPRAMLPITRPGCTNHRAVAGDNSSSSRHLMGEQQLPSMSPAHAGRSRAQRS